MVRPKSRRLWDTQGSWRRKILVIDHTLGSEPHPNRLMDRIMLTIVDGWCTTEAEFQNLFNEVGLSLARVVATRSPNFLVEEVRRGG
jgi:hypothetical protein